MAQFFKDVGLSVAWAAIGVVLLFIAALAFDMLYPIKVREQIEQGNVAVGILLGAVVLGMALIIATAIS